MLKKLINLFKDICHEVFGKKTKNANQDYKKSRVLDSSTSGCNENSFGNWEDLTGSLDVPEFVVYKSCCHALTDVSLSEPSTRQKRGQNEIHNRLRNH